MVVVVLVEGQFDVGKEGRKGRDGWRGGAGAGADRESLVVHRVSVDPSC